MEVDVPNSLSSVNLSINASVTPSVNVNPSDTPAVNASMFPPLPPSQLLKGRHEFRRITVPAHRLSPLKSHWEDLITPIVKVLQLQIRMNVRTKNIELRTSEATSDTGAIQKAADYIKAFLLGYEIKDAIAMLRMDELYIDSFEIEDVKRLGGEHMSRAIGRVSGKDGKTKFMIENATKTRIVLADKHIHILGTFTNIKIARDAIASLILGSPAGKVYSKLRVVSKRISEKL